MLTCKKFIYDRKLFKYIDENADIIWWQQVFVCTLRICFCQKLLNKFQVIQNLEIVKKKKKNIQMHVISNKYNNI